MDSLIENVINKKKMLDGLVVDVEHWDVTLPDGNNGVREVLLHPGAAACIPIDDEGRVAMVRQYRAPIGRITLEIPAGRLNQGEDPLECARRELEEEVGVVAGELTHLVSMHPAAAYCNEKVHIYLATRLSSGSVHLDDDEFLNTEWIPLSELVAMTLRGDIEDSKTIIAILMARLTLGIA